MQKTEMKTLLGPLLNQTMDGARQLLGVLDVERDALVRRDLNALAAAARDKQRLSLELEKLGARQRGLLDAAGLRADKEGLWGFLESERDERLQEQWLELTNVLDQCRLKNRINGGIIEVSRRFSGQVLELLRGSTGTGRLYGPGGETQPGRTGRRSLAQA